MVNITDRDVTLFAKETPRLLRRHCGGFFILFYFSLRAQVECQAGIFIKTTASFFRCLRAILQWLLLSNFNRVGIQRDRG